MVFSITGINDDQTGVLDQVLLHCGIRVVDGVEGNCKPGVKEFTDGEKLDRRRSAL